MRSNGLPAFVVVADAQMQNGQVVRIMAYFIEYRGGVYHFVGYTSPQAFGAFRSAFLQTMQGFGEVRDPRILNRQPVRLDAATRVAAGAVSRFDSQELTRAVHASKTSRF